MPGNDSIPEWELYERMIARMIADQLSTHYTVTPNASVMGIISERRRQIDVLIDLRHDTDNTRRIVVDAKKRKRKVDIKDVEAFRGLMDDVEATHGYLVCPAGYTKAAERRAQEMVSIRVIPLDRLEGFDPTTWPRCLVPQCKSGRVFWDGYPELALRLHNLQTGELILRPFVHYVGKCDRCRRFYVKCLTCNDLLHIPVDDDDYREKCSCNPPWFWLASTELDENDRPSVELHVVDLLTGEMLTTDRRSL